jgi:predicted esterase
MIEERWVEARVHGRVLREAGGSEVDESTWWVGFHGYAENAERSLEVLRSLPATQRATRIAIDALHPFYTKQGEVVGCWMTKRGRELAIADNVAYVRTALEALVAAARNPPARLIAVGFSQGTAMTYRAAAALAAVPLSGAPAIEVVALGGDVPPELSAAELSGLRSVLVGRGDQETWYTEEKLADDQHRLTEAGVDLEVSRYVGGHEWTDEFRGAVERWFLRTPRP